MPVGKHLMAGEWVAGEATFANPPVEGDVDLFPGGTLEHVSAAAAAAEDAFWSFGNSPRSDRASFFRAIADQVGVRDDEITETGKTETGLPEARLNGERSRRVGQLRLFADHIEAGGYLDRRHDEAMPECPPLPRPDLKTVRRTVGPVAVFGANSDRTPSIRRFLRPICYQNMPNALRPSDLA
ncbi:MAG: aldehyde dehydrogenase family protein [Roseibium sp.]